MIRSRLLHLLKSCCFGQVIKPSLVWFILPSCYSIPRAGSFPRSVDCSSGGPVYCTVAVTWTPHNPAAHSGRSVQWTVQPSRQPHLKQEFISFRQAHSDQAIDKSWLISSHSAAKFYKSTATCQMDKHNGHGQTLELYAVIRDCLMQAGESLPPPHNTFQSLPAAIVQPAALTQFLPGQRCSSALSPPDKC